MPFKDRRKQKEYQQKHKEKYQLANKKWRSENKDHCNKYSKEKRRKRRLLFLSLLGGKCVKCGERDWRCLQLDHVKGKGTQERKNLRLNIDQYEEYIIKKVKSGNKNYQLLCANCNWKKRYDNGEK